MNEREEIGRLRELFKTFIKGYGKDMAAIHLRFEAVEYKLRMLNPNFESDAFWREVDELAKQDGIDRTKKAILRRMGKTQEGVNFESIIKR